MEAAESTGNNVSVSTEIPAQASPATSPSGDTNPRKRALETGDDTAGSTDGATPAEDSNPIKRSRTDQDPAIAGKETDSAIKGASANNEEPAAPTEAPSADNVSTGAADGTTANNDNQTSLSKNQLRKLRRQQKWEDGREARKQLRKDKRHEKSAIRREIREEKAEDLVKQLSITKEDALKRVQQMNQAQNPKKAVVHKPVPVAIIIDCDFEKYMREGELVSLASQVTRSYAMNRSSPYMAHLLVSSWGGKMKERFETVLKSHHESWKGVSFVEGDFLEAGKEAWKTMNGPHGGQLCPALGGTQLSDANPTEVKDEPKSEIKDETMGEASEPGPTPATDTTQQSPTFSTNSMVYLSADSPHTLDKLEPNTSYVIGGLVDRNREKLLCQRRAEEKGIRTAKLPIGDYLKMSSRKVLATNHVVEIMAKWLETGDWATAFMEVIPQRKGGQLKNDENEGDYEDENDQDQRDR